MAEYLIKKKAELFESLDPDARRKLFKNATFDSTFLIGKFYKLNQINPNQDLSLIHI